MLPPLAPSRKKLFDKAKKGVIPCPSCRGMRTVVVDSRQSPDGSERRRRRACADCNFRWGTTETNDMDIEPRNIWTRSVVLPMAAAVTVQNDQLVISTEGLDKPPFLVPVIEGGITGVAVMMDENGGFFVSTDNLNEMLSSLARVRNMLIAGYVPDPVDAPKRRSS